MAPDHAAVQAGVSTAILRYADRLDANDLDGLLQCFELDARLEYFGGAVVIEGVERARLFFERTITNKLQAAPQIVTMHLLPNILVERDCTDRAHAKSTGVVYAYTEPGAPIEIRGLAYRHECVHVGDGRWLIAHQEHQALWQYDVISAEPQQRVGSSGNR